MRDEQETWKVRSTSNRPEEAITKLGRVFAIVEAESSKEKANDLPQYRSKARQLKESLTGTRKRRLDASCVSNQCRTQTRQPGLSQPY